MATFSQLVNEVQSNLQGYTLRQDRITNLANPGGITATELGIKIGSADNLAKGIIQIDEELIWINSFDKTNLLLQAIPGFGRGYMGTTPSPHAENARVIMTPTFPVNMITQAINDSINSLYPKLFQVASTTFTFNAAQIAYPLPDDLVANTWPIKRMATS